MSAELQTSLPPLPLAADAYYRQFLDPPLAAGPLPFWFWNGDLREEELRSQLRAIGASGCAGAIIYPRHGLRTRYLSDEWMRLVGTMLREAKSFDLQLWLADDENYPGGVGPDPGEAFSLKAYRFSATAPGEHHFNLLGDVVAACAFPAQAEQQSLAGATVVDLTSDCRGGALHFHSSDERAWTIIVFSSFRYPHTDLLAEGAGERLLNSTHRRYEEALGNLRDAGIEGFFSDEIALVSVWNVPDPEALPWSPALREALLSNSDSGSLLGALLPLAVATEEAAMRRQTFWETVASLYRENFFKPIKAWLDTRGLRWGGHLLFEEPMLAQMASQANYPALVREFTDPTADNLALRPPGEEIIVTASFATDERRSPYVECFGGAGWGLDLAGRRRTFDRVTVRGANRLIPSGVFYSSSGKRKLDAPPGEFLREPFAALYPEFAAAVRRFSWLTSTGRENPRVALFYPLRSAWATFRVTEEPRLARLIEQDFRRTAQLLSETQYAFHVIDEHSLERAEIVGESLRIGGKDFPVLALPSCPYLSSAAWRMIREFFESGGKVVCLGLLPEGFEEGPDAELRSEMLRLAAVEVETVREAYLKGSGAGGDELYTFTRKHPSGGRFSAFQAGLSVDEEFARGEVRQILNSYFPPDVETRELSVRYRRWSAGGLDLYWILSEAQETTDARLGFRSHGSPELWDLKSGARSPLHQYTWVANDQTLVTLRLRPYEGLLIAFPADEQPHVEGASFVVEDVRARGGEVEIVGRDDPENLVLPTERFSGALQAVWQRGRQSVVISAEPITTPGPLRLDEGWKLERHEDNVFVLDEWRFHRDLRGNGRLLLWHRRPHPDWERLGDRQPLTWFPDLEPLEQDRPPFAWFQTDFNVQDRDPGSPLWLALESVDVPLKCWVDGEEQAPLDPIAGRPFRCAALDDPGLVIYDLSAAAGIGHHSINLFADWRSTPTIRPYNRQRIPLDLVPGRARLIGDFRILNRPRGRALTRSGEQTVNAQSWTHCGFPHYSGAMTYRQRVLIPGSFFGCKVFFELESVGVAAQLEVNERAAGRRPWAPFRFDVSHFVVPGEECEFALTVMNTRSNALLGREDPSGILSPVTLRACPILRCSSQTNNKEAVIKK